MRFDRLTTLGRMLEIGMLPTYTPLTPESARASVTACAEAGATVIEILNRAEGTLDIFRDLVRWSAREHPEVILGVGTIYDAPTGALFVDAGANFVVSPVMHEDIARFCNRRRVPFLPGAGSATEISHAEELGVEIVKLFPAAAFDGAAFVRGILGPSPMTRLMPTNVESSEASLQRWFGAGVAAVGVGGSLFTAARVADPRGTGLVGHVAEALGWIRTARG